MNIHRRFGLATALAFLGACACAATVAPTGGTKGSGATARGDVPVDAAVLIASDGAGGFTFKYSAPFADADGNFDFTNPKIGDRSVTISFNIAEGSVAGLRFKPEGRDAMWIVDKRQVGDGSPKGPYEGRQFTNFSVSPDGQTLTVRDLNDDGLVYRYALRFTLDGKTVQHDPDVKNGEGGSGT
ncbi:MAG: hypothetical protein HXY23_10930 [Parvularculaceae bacterium]|nr:hypothetical protein [Parvularculaceae bacterium]